MRSLIKRRMGLWSLTDCMQKVHVNRLFFFRYAGIATLFLREDVEVSMLCWFWLIMYYGMLDLPSDDNFALRMRQLRSGWSDCDDPYTVGKRRPTSTYCSYQINRVVSIFSDALINVYMFEFRHSAFQSQEIYILTISSLCLNLSVMTHVTYIRVAVMIVSDNQSFVLLLIFLTTKQIQFLCYLFSFYNSVIFFFPA